MPLLPGVHNIGHNIKEMQASGHKYSQSLAAALRTAYGPKDKAFGGGVNSAPWYERAQARQMNQPAASAGIGALASPIPGRTDHIPLRVKPGSYVFPADTVSALGQGNSSAGHAVLDRMFKTGPFGMQAGIHAARVNQPRLPSMKPPQPGTIKPGKLGFAQGGDTEDHVPVMAAGGEYVLDPEQVTAVGGGDIDHGHQVLDEFVKHVRKQNIRTLQKLPGPKRD